MKYFPPDMCVYVYMFVYSVTMQSVYHIIGISKKKNLKATVAWGHPIQDIYLLTSNSEAEHLS